MEFVQRRRKRDGEVGRGASVEMYKFDGVAKHALLTGGGERNL